jgi:hypothetical protein
MLSARFAVRGLYFPQMFLGHWLLLLWRNRRPSPTLCSEAFRDLQAPGKCVSDSE